MSPKTEFKKAKSMLSFTRLPPAQVALLLLCLTAVACPAQTYRALHSFAPAGFSEGKYPSAGLALSGDSLYGVTSGGGDFGRGIVFKVNTDGSGYTILKHFTTAEGGLPEAGLIVSGAKLYGTTVVSGKTNTGTVFSIGTDGTGYTVLKEFAGGDGANPHARLLLSGTTLYGTTRSGGDFGHGTVFKVNTDGTDYTLLKSFEDRGDGAEPFAGVVLSGATLYGTTVAGTIFKLQTDGTGFSVLKQLIWNEGANPEGELVLSGSTLYGTTLAGGDVGYGTVFKLNTDGSGFTLLKSFAGVDGKGLRAGLTLVGATLFGTTSDGYGGASPNWGTVFMVNTDGSGFNVLKYFDGSEGIGPHGDLVFSGTSLYGTTGSGAHPNPYGVVFGLSLLEIVSPPVTMTVEAGSTAELSVRASGWPPLGYQWSFNGSIAADGTSSALGLSSVEASNAGAYTVVVSNFVGSVTSPPAMLGVIAPVERRPAAGLYLMGEVGSTLNLEYTDTLGTTPQWLWLDTVALASPPQRYFDLSAPLPSQRFYRVWQSGAPAVGPSLRLSSIVPALTLTGAISSQLRVDGINQIGPTDAWFTLNTVILTNTSQLYFDESAPWQPQRLYRIVPVP